MCLLHAATRQHPCSYQAASMQLPATSYRPTCHDLHAMRRLRACSYHAATTQLPCSIHAASMQNLCSYYAASMQLPTCHDRHAMCLLRACSAHTNDASVHACGSCPEAAPANASTVWATTSSSTATLHVQCVRLNCGNVSLVGLDCPRQS
jgi:hypothetical protein